MTTSNPKQPCLMVMAGGTGGHVFPALAVAKHLAELGWRIQWMGTADRMEAQLVPQHGIEIDFIDIKGIRGNGLVRKLQAPLQISRAVLQARKLIKQHQPDVILGMGGYASGPGGVAAKLCGVPLVLHEQNALAGMTNKLLAKIANQVMVAFPEALPEVANRQLVGNPVRPELFDLPLRERVSEFSPEQPLQVLVIGGSLGARVLNQTLPQALALLGPDAPLAVRHQCGKGHKASTEADYATDSRVTVDEFIHDMADALNWADVVLCRAGALTVSELAAAGRPGIFVPLSHGFDEHQTINARSLTDRGAGVLLPQPELTAERLAEVLRELCAAPDKIQQMARAAREQARPQATAEVAAMCQSFLPAHSASARQNK